MSAATTGVMQFSNQPGGPVVYSRHCYFPDAAAGAIRFDAGGLAGAASPDFTTFDETVYVKDIIISNATTPAATTFRLVLNSQPTTQVFMVALQIQTVVTRAPLSLCIPRGVQFRGLMTT